LILDSDKENPAKREKVYSVRTQNSAMLAEVIKTMSDEKSLLIFTTIYIAGGDESETIREELKLTRKQYYSRISRLQKTGLVKRQKGRYFLTAFGKVIYDSQKLLGTAIKNYWKLRAIDSLALDENEVPKEERKKIIDELLGNQQLKDILLKC
jgi:Mn-dependent DtxR family transcriptional regulator